MRGRGTRGGETRRDQEDDGGSDHLAQGVGVGEVSGGGVKMRDFGEEDRTHALRDR